MRLRSVSVCLSCLLLGSTALAQGNDLLAPTGGRSALMGNTGVALARDGSAPFYNPATIVRIRDERLAFSVNFYSLALSSFSDWHQPGEIDADRFGDRNLGDTGLLESSFRTLPTSLCLFFTLADLEKIPDALDDDDKNDKDDEVPGKKLAICFASFESEDVDLQAIGFEGETAAGLTSQVQSIQRRWNRIYIGPTYSVQVTPKLALGASVQVVYSYESFGLNSSSLSLASDGTSVVSTLGTSGSGRSFELTAVLGASYRWDNVTLGASLRMPSLHIMGKYEGTFNRNDNVDQGATLLATGTGTMYSSPPTRIALGAGIVWPRLTLELNAALGLPLQNALRASIDVHSRTIGDMAIDEEREREEHEIESHVTLNPGAGFEYFLSSGLSMLGGMSMNFTALPPLSPVGSVGNLIQSRTSHISASIGLGSYWDGGELLFGFQLDFGWGQALAVNPYVLPNDWSVVDTRNYAITFVIAGATSLSAIVHLVKTIANGGKGKIVNPEQEALDQGLMEIAPGSNPAAEPMKGKPKPTDAEKEKEEKREQSNAPRPSNEQN
jgi:hypothetical protein